MRNGMAGGGAGRRSAAPTGGGTSGSTGSSRRRRRRRKSGGSSSAAAAANIAVAQYLRLVGIFLALLWGEEATVVDASSSSSSAPPPPDDLSATATSVPFRVAGYLPDYRFYIDANATAPFLTDMYLFSIEPPPCSSSSPKTKSLLDGCCLDRDKLDVAEKARAYKREQQQRQQQKNSADDGDIENLKVWVTIGGGGRSDHFLDDLGGCLTDSLSQTFFGSDPTSFGVAAAVDGIDLDCEAFRSQGDYDRYARWIVDAVPVLKRQAATTAKEGRRPLQVSVAVHVGQLLPPQVYQVVDRISTCTRNY